MEGFAAIVLAAVVGAVLGSASAHEHLRRARVRSRLALLALVSAMVLVGGTSTLAVALFTGAVVGMTVEIFRSRRDAEPPRTGEAAGVEASEAAPR
ncbi:hypothetical protein UQW22_07935 [Isoptericola halotolerans]|uniref:hypothetical protein n=1 Tax=Isoptericola halotolerans TaxID=300560 RepID=UPI003890B237